jgi:hypothetical protein
MMKPEAVWKDMETETQRISGVGVLKRLIAPDSACTMFLGVKRPSLNRLFMLQAPRTLLPHREQIPESKGFELTVQITGEEVETHATLVLTSTDKMYNEVFTAMVENLIQCLNSCNAEGQIVRTFFERLTAWQQFFQKNGANGLGEETQRGIFGELYFIRNHLLSTPDHFANEISGWTGSKNRQHDFQFGETVVEVKTCSTKQHQKLQISSEQQLDESLVGSMFVFHLSLSLVDNLPNTLPALVAGLREILRANYMAVALFEQGLLERGYLDTQAWRYQKTGYVIRELNAFRVADGFPRLTERDLPPGVGDLTYSISIAECRKFAVSIEDVILQIQKGLL